MKSPVLTEESTIACIAGSSDTSVRSEATCRIEGAGTRWILADMAQPGVNFTDFGHCKITGKPCDAILVEERWYPAAAAFVAADRAPAALAVSQLFCEHGGVIFVKEALATSIHLTAEAEPLVEDTSPFDGDVDLDAGDLAKLFFDPSQPLDWLGLVPVGGWLVKAIRSGSKVAKLHKLVERIKRLKQAIENARRLMKLRRAARGIGDVLDGAKLLAKGKMHRFSKTGGLRQARRDFDDLVDPSSVELDEAVLKGKLRDGSGTISFRDFSTDGRPTVQITRSGSKQTKIRYDE